VSTIKFEDEDGETQNTTVQEYADDDSYVQVINHWHHDAEGVLIPRDKIPEFVQLLKAYQ
jgi:hypothetical protein